MHALKWTTRKSWVLPTLVSIVLLFLPTRARAAARAGADDAGSVTGVGKVVLNRPATVMRMQIDVPAEGKTVGEALEQLKAKRQALAAKLKSLGAAEAGVQFGDPRVGASGPGGNAQQRYLQQMMRMQRGNRAAAKKPHGPAMVSVTLPVTAEWTLKASGAEEAIIAGHKLRETVKSAGLLGKDAAGAADKKLEPEEEAEMEEEMAGLTDDGTGAAAPLKPGEPRFTFVAKITDPERAAASKEAFQKARAEATQIAEAAGGKVGRLRMVTAQVGAAAGADEDGMGAYNRYMMQAMGMDPGSEAVPEASGTEPGMVSLRITVSASFAME